MPTRALPELGDDAKLVLARRLVREGLLTVIGAPPKAARPASSNRTAAPRQGTLAPEAGCETWWVQNGSGGPSHEQEVLGRPTDRFGDTHS